jgi:sugar phosphate isomerase/epimerase
MDYRAFIHFFIKQIAMSYNRRKFLQSSSMLASGLALSSLAGRTLAAGARSSRWVDGAQGKKLKDFGLQLWTVKDVMGPDPAGTLKQVASFGYKQVEGFEGQKGMFWGMSNTDFSKTITDLGMSFISSHCGIQNDAGQFEKKAAQAGAIGMKYLICPYLGKQKTLDDYKTASDTFNKCGAICQKNGLRFAYHNHWYSFQVQDGVKPQTIFMANTDPALVDFEMDIYWVVTAGSDPVEWLEKYPNRFRLCHFKDRLKTADPANMDASCDLGTGSIDFAKIGQVAAKNGMQYYIVEQEKYTGTTLAAASVDAAYMSKLSL